VAQLNFNLLGYSFQQGLEVLRKSFSAAVEGLQALDDRAQATILAYDAHVAAGGARIGAWSEEGEREWEQDQILAYEAEIAQDAAQDLMNAFAIALYHHWERWARVWGKLPRKGNFEDMVAATLAQGYPIHPDLHRLKDIANVLKHHKDQAGEAVTKAWPDLAPHGFRRLGTQIDWYASIRISPTRMSTLFEIVSASGPTANLLARGLDDADQAVG
jgi:hypothetical protein